MPVRLDSSDLTHRLPLTGEMPDRRAPAAADTRLGPYSGATLIGVGGMGVVYKATDPNGRTVAVKVIPVGAAGPRMDSTAARLEREWRTLAALDHPNVAQVFESGRTADGRPYFTMEYIPGVPLGRYADDKRLTVRQRLELFLGVAAAVAHLHRQGIIHRDLKPGNVLVAEVDDVPVPKLIDFGLAKLVGEAAGATTVGGYVGTPNYMAPEQATGKDTGIDTRADVYALGAILYELLAGTVPHARPTDGELGVLELILRLQVSDPPAPSARCGEPTVGERAAERATTPPALRAELAGDLDRVVLKALARNREERYGTVDELAADVRRYLANEPVSVGAPSRARQLARFVRRNRALVAGVTLVLLLLSAAVAVTASGLIRARDAEKLATARLIETERARADLAKTLAESEVARQVAQGERDRQREDADTLRDEWYHATARGLSSPAVKSAILALGAAAEDPALHTAVRVRIWVHVADALVSFQDAPAALPFAERVLAEYRRKYGATHRETRAAAFRLANYLTRVGRHRDAIPLYEEMLPPFGRADLREPIQLLVERMGLALCYQTVGRAADARAVYREVAERGRGWYGPTHPAVASATLSLAILTADADPADACRLADECRPVVSVRPVTQFPDRDEAVAALVWIYLRGEKADATEPLCRALLARQEVARPEHWRTAFLRSELGWCLYLQKRPAEAEPLLVSGFEQAARRSDQMAPSEGGFLASMKDRVVELCEATGRPTEAALWRAKPLPTLTETAPPPRPVRD